MGVQSEAEGRGRTWGPLVPSPGRARKIQAVFPQGTGKAGATGPFSQPPWTSKPAFPWPSCLGALGLVCVWGFCLVRTPQQHLLRPEGPPFSETALRVGKKQVVPKARSSLSWSHAPLSPHQGCLSALSCSPRPAVPFHEGTEPRAECQGWGRYSPSSSGLCTGRAPPDCLWDVGPSSQADPHLETPDLCPLLICVGHLCQFPTSGDGGTQPSCLLSVVPPCPV